MSTKTTFKRVALVAAVAAALAGVSTVAANAATLATLTSGQSGQTPASSTVTGAATATVGTYAVETLTAGTDSYYSITSSGVGSVLYPTVSATGGTPSTLSANGSAEVWSQGAGSIGTGTFTNSYTLVFSATSAVAGTQSIVAAGSSGSITYNITWGSAPTYSAANSTAYIKSVTTGAADTTATVDTAAGALTSDASIVAPKGTGQVAAIYLTVKNNVGAGTAITTGSFSATVSGSGLLTGNATSGSTAGNMGTIASGVTRSATSYPDSSGIAAFYVYGDNTSGTGTITVTYTDKNAVTSAFTTKSVIFSGTTPATLTASQSAYVATAGLALGSADAYVGDGAITVSALDTNGNPVASLAGGGSSIAAGFYLVSDNTSCITTTLASGNVHDGGTAVSDGVTNAYGTYNLQVTAASGAVSGCSANVTVHYYVSSTSDIAATPIKFTVGGTKIASITLTTDATSYTPGQKVLATLTAKDSVGNPVADGSYGVFYDKATNIASVTTNGSATGVVAAGTTVYPISLNAQTTTVPFSITGATSSANGTGAGAGTISGSDETYSFANGVASSKFYAPYADGTVTLNGTLAATNATSSKIATALLGSAISASFTVATGASTAATDATDAANEATDAANAATDAANAAADAADAATSAAQDASAQAQAALAAVTALSAKITVLAAQIAKIIKKLGA
jgi:hypothetical protein